MSYEHLRNVQLRLCVYQDNFQPYGQIPGFLPFFYFVNTIELCYDTSVALSPYYRRTVIDFEKCTFYNFIENIFISASKDY